MLITRTLSIVTITWSVAVLGKKAQVFPVITDPTADLYKGTVGILPCRYQREISSVVWNKGQSLADARVLISLYIDGNGDSTRSGPGFTRGEVDIADNLSLIIKRVKVEDEGRYYCNVADLENELSYNNYTDVSVVAFASGPVIEQCVMMNQGRLHTDPSSCTYDASNHPTKFNLTCKLSGFKPDVSLSWCNTSKDLKPLHSTKATLADGTLERTVTVVIDPKDKGIINFTCTAVGKAVNGTVWTSVSIVNTKITVPSTVTQEKWKRIVMCASVTSVIIILILIAICRGRKLKETFKGFPNINWRYGQYRLLSTLLGEDYERHELIKKAMKAQQAGKYDDATKLIVNVIKMKDHRLSVTEQRLLKDAYRKLINEPRTLLRNLDYGKEGSESGSTVIKRRNVISEDREKIKLRLIGICVKVVELLDEFLIKQLPNNPALDVIEENIFYLTMKGDYLRYMMVCKSREEIEGLSIRAISAYEKARNLSMVLPPAHAARLRINIKLSVLYFEILHQKEKACELAREAIKAGSTDFDQYGDDERTDRVRYMFTLHRFLEYWTAGNRQNQRPHSESETEDAC